MKKIGIALFIILGFAVYAMAEFIIDLGAPPSNLIFMPAANNLSTNWQNAGLAKIGGIPTRNTQCGSTVTPTGLTPPQANDDAAVINAAIAACPAGQVVQLGSGTFQIDNGVAGFSGELIIINNGVTLRGNGSCSNASYPYCNTVINNYSGVWTSYAKPGGLPQCAHTTLIPPSGSPGTLADCPNGTNPMVLVTPFTCCGNEGWGFNSSSSGASGCQANNQAVSPLTDSCGTILDADAAQGATTVRVHDTSNLSVGDWVLIDENPQLVTTTNPISGQASIQTSAEFLSTSPSPITPRMEVTDIPLGTYSMGDNRLNSEIHLISAVGAGPCPGANCTITFDDPLTMAKRQTGSHDARVYWPTLYNASGKIAFTQQAGIENITFTRATTGSIVIEYCAYCWIKNVETAYWSTGVNFNFSARSELTRTYLHDCADCDNDGNEYPFGINTGSTEILADNNITVLAGKGMVGRAANTSVVAYNYQDKTFYQPASGVGGDWFVDMGVNGTHYANTHHFLFEGNWGDNCDGDETHGSSSYHLYFRNDCTGIRSSFVDPSNGQTVSDAANTCFTGASTPLTCAPLRAAGPMAYNYWYAYVGNVLGLSGVTTTGNGWVYFACANNACGAGNAEVTKSIWMTGWTGSEWGTNEDPNLDGVNGTPFIFRNGNYDYVTPGVADNAAGYSQAFPNSMYLNSAPAFFGPGASCTYTWPWIQPTASPPVKANSCSGSGLPAKARFDAGTPFVQP